MSDDRPHLDRQSAKHRARALQAIANHICTTDLTDGFCGPRDGACCRQKGSWRRGGCNVVASGILQALESNGMVVVWDYDPALWGAR